MALVLRAHVVMLVTTGRFARSVVEYAKALAETSAMQAVLIDGDVLASYKSRGASAIIDWLEESAHHVMRLKKKQLHGDEA